MFTRDRMVDVESNENRWIIKFKYIQIQIKFIHYFVPYQILFIVIVSYISNAISIILVICENIVLSME